MPQDVPHETIVPTQMAFAVTRTDVKPTKKTGTTTAPNAIHSDPASCTDSRSVSELDVINIAILIAKIPTTTVSTLATTTCCFSDAFLFQRFRYKSLKPTAARLFMPESSVDMTAANMAASTRPGIGRGSLVATNRKKAVSPLLT